MKVAKDIKKALKAATGAKQAATDPAKATTGHVVNMDHMVDMDLTVDMDHMLDMLPWIKMCKIFLKEDSYFHESIHLHDCILQPPVASMEAEDG